MFGEFSKRAKHLFLIWRTFVPHFSFPGLENAAGSRTLSPFALCYIRSFLHLYQFETMHTLLLMMITIRVVWLFTYPTANAWKRTAMSVWPTYKSCHSCFSAVPKNYQHVLALAFAVNEIKENPNILPNVTLGFHIYDNYFDARMTYQNTLNLLSTWDRPIPNFNCGIQKNLISIIGTLDSETSLHVTNLLDLYRIPQESHRAWQVHSFDMWFASFFPTVGLFYGLGGWITERCDWY